MVQRAEAEPVLLDVGPVESVPLNVRRFDSEVRAAEASVESTHRAAALVDSQDQLTEVGVPRPPAIGLGAVGHADGVQDVLVQRRWEAPLEHASRNRTQHTHLTSPAEIPESLEALPVAEETLARNRAAEALIRAWMQDDSGYDEATFAELKLALESSRKALGAQSPFLGE